MTLQLTSSHYRRSPLVQGGLEIRCKISVKTGVHFNRAVLERYRALSAQLYVEPKEEEILGSFLLIEDSEHFERDKDDAVAIPPIPPIRTKKNCITETPVKSKDIRNFFTKERKIEFRVCGTNKVIQID